MKRNLRVLWVEDSEADAFFLARKLEWEGFALTSQRVQSEDEMRRALDEKEWDVIISDHIIPGFGSTEALAVLREKNLDIPFIIVSGQIGESAAVAAMKSGANDYVLKNSPGRLAPIIDRELEEAVSRRARRRAEAELHRKRIELEDFFSNAPLPVHWESLDGTILRANEAELQLMGFSRNEYVGRNVREFHVHDCVADDYLSRLYRGEVLEDYEALLRAKDGSVKNVMINCNGFQENGQFIHSRCFTRDITDRKRQEEVRVKLIEELTDALAKVKTLRGLLPICSACKKIRDDQGYWQRVEGFLTSHTGVEFTHGICPDCMRERYPEYSRAK